MPSTYHFLLSSRNPDKMYFSHPLMSRAAVCASIPCHAPGPRGSEAPVSRGAEELMDWLPHQGSRDLISPWSHAQWAHGQVLHQPSHRIRWHHRDNLRGAGGVTGADQSPSTLGTGQSRNGQSWAPPSGYAFLTCKWEQRRGDMFLEIGCFLGSLNWPMTWESCSWCFSFLFLSNHHQFSNVFLGKTTKKSDLVDIFP